MSPAKIEEATPVAERHLETEEHIRQRAHEIWEARGGAPGNELDDWLQAEREILGSQKDTGQERTQAAGGGKKSRAGYR